MGDEDSLTIFLLLLLTSSELTVPKYDHGSGKIEPIVGGGAKRRPLLYSCPY